MISAQRASSSVSLVHLRLQLHGAIYRPDSFVLMPRCYCANLKAIRYESTSFNRIVSDKSHRVIAALAHSMVKKFYRSYFILDASPKRKVVHLICGSVRLTHDIMHVRLKGSLLCKSSLAFPNETVSEVFTGSKRKREG